jgi:hypothetical protein
LLILVLVLVLLLMLVWVRVQEYWNGDFDFLNNWVRMRNLLLNDFLDGIWNLDFFELHDWVRLWHLDFFYNGVWNL